ncbi:MAG: ornithine cyclodeaminase family protein [Bdellovibrionales bacterium]|nr:ornithine cyclodeaminase family protein [Bdellovibrionales bacterium]
MRYLGPAEIRQALDPLELSERLRAAFADHARGRGANSPRLVLPTVGRGALGAMLAVSPADGLVGAKLVSVNPENPARGLNPHQGIVVLLDPDTGEFRAGFDASEITALRTVALSIAATKALARADARTLAVFGTGLQAYLHAIAVPRVRSIEEIRIVGRDPLKTARLQKRLRDHFARIGRSGPAVKVDTNPAEAARAGDVLCLCTAIAQPYLRFADLRPGAHVNAVGACRPGMREILVSPRDPLAVFVDDRERAREEAEEIRSYFVGERADRVVPLGDVFAGTHPGRVGNGARTLFKSVGVGLQDIVAAGLVLENLARREKHS